MDSLRQEIATLQKEKEEIESRKKREEEERRKERERNNCLDSSMERLLEARNEEVKKSSEIKRQLDALHAARASLQYEALEAAADDNGSAVEEDELELGAESADFQLVQSKRKRASRKAAQAAKTTPTPSTTPTPASTLALKTKATSGKKTPPTRRAAASSAPTASRGRVESTQS